MGADESFLARWSRRKHGAATIAPERPPPEAIGDRAQRTAVGTAGSEQGKDPAVDLARLPPIESIGDGSDITPFLASGVPADLTRAALRRAWSADPAIRDFIGLAENSWDFTAPGGAPGFGSVTAEEVERLLARLAGEPKGDEVASPSREPSSTEQMAALDGDGIYDATPEPCADTSQPARRHDSATRPSRPPRRQRRHGGALPE
jgi:hypothetical protein